MKGASRHGKKTEWWRNRIICSLFAKIVEEQVDIIKSDAFSNLLKAVFDLNIDIKNVMDDPMSIVDNLKDPKTNDLKEVAVNIFGGAASDEPYKNSSYSSILHATLSKYVVEFSNESSDGLSIVVPNGIYDTDEDRLINSIRNNNT